MPDQPIDASTVLVIVRDHICTTLPYPSYQSLPIPISYKQQLGYVSLIGRGEFVTPESGYMLYKPHLLSVIRQSDRAVLRAAPDRQIEAEKEA